MRKLLSFSVLLLSCIGLYAQASGKTFRHITVEDGLSSNHVRSIIQDRFGFVWAGTDQELNRYDGSTVRTFSFPEKWTGVTTLAMLEDGQFIWIGTNRGLFRFSYETEQIERFDGATEEGVAIEDEVNNISKDLDGNIWLSTMGQGVFRFNPRTSGLDSFDFSSCDGNVAIVYADNANQIWALTNWGTPVLYRLNKTTYSFNEFPMFLNGKKMDVGGLALFEDSRMRFWLGTWTDGLYEVDRQTGNVVMHLDPVLIRQGINHIHSIIETESGKLAIGSDDGILVYDTDKKDVEYYGEGIVPSYGLSSRFVYPLLKDREGGLWAGTYYGGINYRSPFVDQFKGYTHNRFNSNSVGGKVISCFCEDSRKNVWIASDDGGLSCFNPRSGDFKNYRSSSSGLTYDNIHALCVDGDDLWIGTYTGGVNVMDMNTGKFRLYMPVEGDETSLDGTSSYAIMKDMEGDVWVATMSGINLYDRKNDSFKRVLKTEYHIVDIDQDKSGNIWFSTLGGGILKLDKKEWKWKTYKTSNEELSIPGDYVNCGFCDSKGVMWFGTSSGLCYYRSEIDGFHRYEIDSSLSDISGIVEDNQVFWVTTDHGLMRIDNTGDIQVFSTSDGLRSSHFVSNSIFKASDGCIYIGTTNGFNAFHPYQIRANHTPPVMAIIGLTVDNEPVLSGNPILKKSLGSDLPRIELSHHHNALTVRYASLSFCIPEKNQYAYMLEGFDEDWNDVGNRNMATYTNLPVGKYIFKVMGTNNDAIWNDQPAMLEVIVRPHPLLSTPFMILYYVLGLLLIISIVLLAVKMKSKEYEKQMVELEDRKEKEVYDAKIKFFTMIAHEIRTPVSLIIGPLENIIRKSSQLPDKVNMDLQTIDRNSQRLLYLVNQLLDFRKVEQDAMVMHFVSEPIVPLLKSVCERFEPTISQNGAEFIVDYPQYDFNVWVDSESITKLISNLLTNASKYTKDIVRLSCHICPEDSSKFCITVYDNGCGISKEEQSKIFLPFYQTLENKPGTGIGLSLVKSIVEMHGGTISVDSEVGVFSSFKVLLPICQKEAGQTPKKNEEEDEKSPENLSMNDILKSDVIEMRPEYKPVVLIVDDNDEIVRFLSDTLSDKYQTLSAYNGNEALQMLEIHPETALIIADWMMPGIDGVELCRQVRANMATSHIPYILLTAKTDDPSKVAGMNCGADMYIEKPFSVQYLEACVGNQIAMRAMLRQRYSTLPLTPLTDVANNNVDNRFLQMMTNLIEANLSDSNLSVDFLTEQMGISRSSFYNKIKSLTNSTPNELIQLMRLKKAAQLLTEHKYRINEICYMVGFNNPSYFSKCFYKQFGMKPGEFAAKSAE